MSCCATHIHRIIPGRWAAPRIELSADSIINAYQQYHTWEQAAKALDVDEKTLRARRNELGIDKNGKMVKIFPENFSQFARANSEECSDELDERKNEKKEKEQEPFPRISPNFPENSSHFTENFSHLGEMTIQEKYEMAMRHRTIDEPWTIATYRQGYHDYNQLFSRDDYDAIKMKMTGERKQQFFFIAPHSKLVEERIRSMDFNALAERNTATPGFGKGDFVSYYTELFGC